MAALVLLLGCSGSRMAAVETARVRGDEPAGAALTWSCTNGIQWPATTNGAFWWAGHDPVADGKVITATAGRDSVGIPIHRATGRLNFDSRNRATFHSDAGGTIVHRIGAGTLLTAVCAFGGPLGSR